MNAAQLIHPSYIIARSLLEELVEGEVIKGGTLALDATFIEAYSRRDTADDSHGLSDPEARVGRDGKSYGLGYKAHVAMDVVSDMPVAVVRTSANENEKKHAEELLDKASTVVEEIKAVVAYSLYRQVWKTVFCRSDEGVTGGLGPPCCLVHMRPSVQTGLNPSGYPTGPSETP